MRKFKKQISAVTLLFFCAALFCRSFRQEAAPYTDLTDAQIEAVVSWAYDKAYGSPYSNYQCLAYVYQAYHNAIGVNIGPGGSFGSAIEASRNLPLHYDAPANVPKRCNCVLGSSAEQWILWPCRKFPLEMAE